MALSTAMSAANAYGAVAKLTANGSAIGAAGAKSTNSDFEAMVQNALQGVIDKGAASDSAQQQLIQGKTDIVNVVTSVAEAETAMQTLVSVRDRVISAYQEIMKMSI